MTGIFDIKIYLNSLFKKKPKNLIILDLRELEAITDFFIICHGQSKRQVTSIAEHVKTDLRKKNIVPFSFEGISEGNWAILDYNWIVIHVFEKGIRDIYNLEKIWFSAKIVDIDRVLN